jgi:hypothetical protein
VPSTPRPHRVDVAGHDDGLWSIVIAIECHTVVSRVFGGGLQESVQLGLEDPAVGILLAR